MNREVAAVAQRDFAVVSLEEMLACGVTRSSVDRRVRAGELFPQYPGVYALGRPDLTAAGHRMAAVKACGQDACLSFASAAAQWGMRKSAAAYIDVMVPAGRPPRRLPGIRCHRADLAPQDVSLVDGIPCTSVARTLLDLSSRFGDATVESAANEASVLEIFDLREVEELLARSRGRRGVRRLRRVLERGDIEGENNPKSEVERRFAALCKRHGLPKPGLNRWVLLGDEYHEVDCLWREWKVVIEVDSKRYHRTGWKLARDARRDELLPAGGYLHERVTDELIGSDPFAAVGVARALMEARGWRPS